MRTLLSVRHGVAAAVILAVAAPAFAQNTDDDDEEGPPAKAAEPAAAPEKAPEKAAEKAPVTAAPEKKPEKKEEEAEKKPEEGAPAGEEEAAKPATKPAKKAITADQGYLEGRAEVESPNEEIHTVQKKTYTAANRFEATVYPAALQLNSKFTNTDGVAIGIGFALQENFALQVMGLFNYIGGWSPLTGQLLDIKARPEAADQLILQGGVEGGFEVAPIYGKFAFYDGMLAQFRFVLNAGVGAGATEVQLSGSTSKFPSNQTSYGSTGWRFLGNLGGGFRVLIGDRLALRLEVRDLVYTARVDTIEGCNQSDLVAIGSGTTSFNDGCGTGNFVPVPNNNQATQQHSSALEIATNLVKDNSSDVVNDIIFFGGLSFLF